MLRTTREDTGERDLSLGHFLQIGRRRRLEATIEAEGEEALEVVAHELPFDPTLLVEVVVLGVLDALVEFILIQHHRAERPIAHADPLIQFLREGEDAGGRFFAFGAIEGARERPAHETDFGGQTGHGVLDCKQTWLDFVQHRIGIMVFGLCAVDLVSDCIFQSI